MNNIRVIEYIISAFVVTMLLSGATQADPTTQNVDWRISGGGKIKQIRYFTKPQPQPQAAPAAAPETAVTANVIDSPPVDGFVPWIVAITTDKKSSDDTVWTADVELALDGNLTTSNIQDNYALAIFDTGASAHVFGYHNSVAANLFTSYRTNNQTTITGVTGAVDAYISKPIGMFIKGLAALEPNSPTSPQAKLRSTEGFMGQSNVAIIIGDNPGPFPDLATAIGSPMSVYFTTYIRNDTPVTVTRNGKQYTAPDIQLYRPDDPAAPAYVNKLPLELRPLGGTGVQYIAYNLDDFITDIFNLTFEPTTPSIIVGNAYQSLFFVHGVDLKEGSHSTLERDRFMLDTGAQITVIGNRIASRLGLRPSRRDFEVEIEGVTGESIMAPGFYIDALTIPTLGEWLEYTNVPVVLLEIASPEGGKLDGIIGMNLFTEYNLIFRGGGLFLQDDPVLEFKRIGDSALAGDITPLPDGDGVVDAMDFSVYSRLWKTTTASPEWNPKADIAPAGSPDGIIDLLDLARFAENWLNGL